MNINLEDALSMLSDLSVILSLLIIVFQSTIALKQYKSSIEQKKKDRALGLITRWNDLEFAKIRRETMIYFDQITMANFENHKSDLEKNTSIRGYAARVINFFEEAAIGVNRNVHDFDIVYTFFHPVVTYYWEMLLPFIEYVRKRDHDETIWKEVEMMYHLFIKKATENYVIPPGRFWKAF